MNFVEFSLDPIEEIQPWGSEGAYRLSWFGFSLGRYRLRFGDECLLNNSSEACAHIEAAYPGAYAGPWVDYQVVRLWEDLLELLPYALAPVPDGLAPFMVLDEARWRRWMSAAHDISDAGSFNEDDIDLLDGWRNRRFLDTGYLSPSANVWFWRVHGDVEVRWDSADKVIDGHPAWSAIRGAYRMSQADFVSGLQAFNDQFIEQMGQRVRWILDGGYRPDVQVDLDWLAKEQVDRSGWFARALARNVDEDANGIVAAARQLLELAPIPE